MEKRGLSAVVTTVIMILLVLFAIGIVYVVVKDILGSSGEQITIGQKCVATQLEIDSVSCDGTNCNVVVKKTGGYTINGVLVAVSDATTSFSDDIGGNIELMKTVTLVTAITATKTTAAAYFNDADANPVTCSQVAEYP